MTAVHQLLPVLSPGDAIGGAVRQTQKMLRGLGFESEIFATAIDPELRGEAHDPTELQTGAGRPDAVLYHASLYSALGDTWSALDCKRVLVYHNITPAKYFRDVSARVSRDLETGREQLRSLVGSADLCISDSRFNADDLEPYGPVQSRVIPPPVDLDRLHPQPSRPSRPVLLFVGRLAPNKRQDFLVSVLAALRQGLGIDARLVLAGGGTDTNDYVTALRWRAHILGVEDVVTVPSERLSDETLRNYYRDASVFVCASEHEGFCIPLLEAMAFEIPIVALDAGAVPDTARDAAIVLSSTDPFVWAEMLKRLLDDDLLRQTLIQRGKNRLKAFTFDRIASELRAALASVGVVP